MLKVIAVRRTVLCGLIVLLAAIYAPCVGWCDEKPSAQLSVEEVVERVRKSVVVITITGRDGNQQGLGSGFVIDPDGLIATNLHVIGEARPIHVQLADGERHEVTAIHASDRKLDLAIIKIEAKGLPALELGDSSSLKQGQAVVALGNPRGLTHSVVSGVVSGTRAIAGREMIQLAIPIEPGNSGGPLVDLSGRVHGVLTLKAALTENLGFAMPSNALKALLEKPNPAPIERWLTIGVLDSRQWTTLNGGRWRQRAGRILVSGPGEGFGGRTLCLANEAPTVPYEVEVLVRIDDSRGAAGLAFASDGAHRHYGFYPSAGKLRLTRFDGPDVLSWRVLHDEPSEHLRENDWNTLKVRVEEKRVICFINGEKAVELALQHAPDGKVGLVNFRDTQAEFKSFRTGSKLESTEPSDEIIERIREIATQAPDEEFNDELIESLSQDADAAAMVLEREAKLLERRAERLKELGAKVQTARTLRELESAVAKDDSIDLFHAGLLIAKLDNPSIDVEAYRRELDGMAEEIASKLDDGADDQAKLAALDEYLFQNLGFHGSRAEYYHRSNSYLNEVLDDREGLPITLSVIYMELAERLGVPVVGVGLPGHFVVRHEPAKGDTTLIDVYDAATPLTLEEAAARVIQTTGAPLREAHLKAVSKRDILARMLHNLRGLAEREGALPDVLRYQDALIVIAPDSAEERVSRAIFRMRGGELHAALEDVDWLLDRQPAGVDIGRVQALREFIEQQIAAGRAR